MTNGPTWDGTPKNIINLFVIYIALSIVKMFCENVSHM